MISQVNPDHSSAQRLRADDFSYLLGFVLLLVRVWQRLLLGLDRGFGEQILELFGVYDIRLFQWIPERVITVKHTHTHTHSQCVISDKHSWQGHELPLFFILYCSLRSTYNIIKIFTSKNINKLFSILFLIPSSECSVWIGVGDCGQMDAVVF